MAVTIIASTFSFKFQGQIQKLVQGIADFTYVFLQMENV
jgi:hypothetical protein